MPSKDDDERLIILLPTELLEEVRRAAEEADLSVSQIVRRALRRELKHIELEKTGHPDQTLLQELGKLLAESQRVRFTISPTGGTVVVPGATPELEKINPTAANKILRRIRGSK
jgi:Ribbon-helix-helix protein, copG family